MGTKGSTIVHNDSSEAWYVHTYVCIHHADVIKTVRDLS